MAAVAPDTRCDYVFDPEEWETETGTESPLSDDDLDDDVWRCPHTAHADRDLCLFHLPPAEKADEAVHDALLDQLEEPGREAKRFIGARFGSLDLAHAIVESSDNFPIDLRHATFDDTTTWKYAIVRQPLRLEGATFHDAAYFTETAFENEVYFTKATFHDVGRFIEASFTAGGWFYDAQFDEANFSLARFGGRADFIQAHFGRVHLREAEFSHRVDFKQTTFEHAMFWGAEFDGDVSFSEASIPEQVDFRQTRFTERCDFSQLTVPESGASLDFGEATIAQGALLQPPDGTLIYDLSGATIGDVTLAESPPPDGLFSKYRFLNTTFEGFEFAPYRDSLNSADWKIHGTELVSGVEGSDTEPSAGELESTYLKVKNGANTVGDTRAAAEFFRKEMLYRRYQYVPTIRDAGASWRARTAAAWRWGANLLLDVTAGYGERPSRVVTSSVGVILVFAALFAGATETPPYGSSIGYLILSLESFITLVLGGAEDVTEPLIRLLAEVEGFIGAFLIALFVFTLTRSIHR